MLRKRVYSGYVAHPERIPTDVLEVALAGMGIPGTSHATQTMLHAVTTLGGLRPELQMQDRMATLQVPTLFTWGEDDRIAAPSIGDDLAARMSDAKFTVIEDAGHIPHIDQPAAVAEAINRSLRESD
jgi:pimeloyl-ACP methyl ester carboxylesterase